MDQKTDFIKRWIGLFEYTHARTGIGGTKRLHKCNPHIRKLIWVFPGASYFFHSMAGHQDVSCNLQWFMDQFYKPRHSCFSWRGCHGVGDSYGVDTKFLGCLSSCLWCAWIEPRLIYMFCWTHKQYISTEKTLKEQLFQVAFSALQKVPFFDNYSGVNLAILGLVHNCR